MSDDLMELIQNRFNVQRDEYLRLVDEASKARAEVEKVAERLKLMRRLLELEGEAVRLPPEREAKPPKRRRSAA